MKLLTFLMESNAIEGILLPPSQYQVGAATIFLALNKIKVADVSNIVNIFEPEVRLRERFGMDTMVGDYIAPQGGPEVRGILNKILERINSNSNHPVYHHKDFQNLHPYTDCNGRSGRLVWLWQMKKFDYQIFGSFLRTFYYQTLEQQETRNSNEPRCN